MKFTLSPEDYESLDKIKLRGDYAVLEKMREQLQENLFIQAAGVKTRHIQNGNVTIIESADSQIKELAGTLLGFDMVLNEIGIAHKKLKKDQ